MRTLPLLALLGCDAEAPSTPSTPATEPVVQAAVLGVGGPIGIQSRGKLRVAADPDAAPFLSKAEAGHYEGFEYVLMARIADKLTVPVEIVPSTFPGLVEEVKAGRADLAIGQLSPSPAYGGLDWSVSYLQYSLCLVVGKDSKAKSLADLKGKKIGMYDDPVARQVADVLVGGSYERVLFEDYGYFEKMVRGQLDAMIYDCPLARYEMKMYGDNLKIVDANLNVTSYAAAVAQGNPELLTLVNDALKELGEQGTLAQLSQQWLGEAEQTGVITTATGKVVVVGKGDTLSTIAQKELGDLQKWKALYEANVDVIGPNPDIIYKGMRLRLPA